MKVFNYHEDPVKAFSTLLDIIKELRSPDGCPWDRKQTVESMLPHIIEETYESIDALSNGDIPNLAEEIGDLYLLVVMVSYILEQTESIKVYEVINGISQKLVRRHPHVFGDLKVDNAEEVIDIWNTIKITLENRAEKNTLLDSIPLSMPPLERAYKIQKKVSKIGFDWEDPEGVFKKIHEEIDEFKDVLDENNKSKMLDEFGDILFSIVNAGRFYGIDPAEALHHTNQKFYKRFRFVEEQLLEKGNNLTDTTPQEMNILWEEAKKLF
ncbi:MAG: nucleoside triphosphate pyrophosphohydrolase [Spirochaetes bacterium]|nr:MAG: nucleoside triphosphate pyrophosphohydrolase [Spirochaetota bacterium]